MVFLVFRSNQQILRLWENKDQTPEAIIIPKKKIETVTAKKKIEPRKRAGWISHYYKKSEP